MLALGPERMLGLRGRMGLLGLLLLLLLLLLMLLRLGMKGLTPVSHHLRGVFSLRAAVSGEIYKSLAFFSSGHARSMRRQGVERGNSINNPDRTKLSGAKNEQAARSQTDSCQTIASASGAEVTGRSGRAACFVVPAG